MLNCNISSAWLVSSSGLGMLTRGLRGPQQREPAEHGDAGEHEREQEAPVQTRRFRFMAGTTFENWKKTPKLPYWISP